MIGFRLPVVDDERVGGTVDAIMRVHDENRSDVEIAGIMTSR